MRLLIRYAPPFRRWHLRLGRDLEADGHVVGYRAGGRPVGRVLLAAERRLYRVVAFADASEPAPTDARGDGPDLTIELCQRGRTEGAVLSFDVNGREGESGLLAAARTGTAPQILVHALAPGGERRLLAAGRPAIEDPTVAARAMETLLPRLVTLLVQGVRVLQGDLPRLAPLEEGGATAPPPPLRFLLRGVAAKLSSRLGPGRGRPEHWRIGLRRVGDSGGTMLPDVPGRFRADPFLLAREDRLWLFAEDYPYATGRGVVTCQDLGPLHRGECASPPTEVEPPRTVLDTGTHLSYPLVLRHEGGIFMLPESAAAKQLVLYRADPFPWRWVADSVLLAGRYADATPVQHAGRWWLFATSDADGGSSWDQLCLFHAPDLRGPWTAHAANPVVIDAGAARPAGHMWHENGALMRPVQDCRRGYGGGIVIYRVDQLDADGFRQVPARRLEPPAGSPASGFHTINRDAGWEAYDLKVPHPTSRG